MDLKEIEAAIAAEAAAHARACLELNPFLDAEVVALGRCQLVYAGVHSPIHGVFGLGLDGEPDETDWQEIEKFFQQKERAPYFWVTPFTPPQVKERISSSHSAQGSYPVHGITLSSPTTDPLFSPPDRDEWALAFSQREKPERTSPDLFALTKMQQKETRFFLENPASGAQRSASYTFFHRGVALVPFPASPLLPLQQKETFRSTAFVVMGSCDLPFLYERILYAPF